MKRLLKSTRSARRSFERRPRGGAKFRGPIGTLAFDWTHEGTKRQSCPQTTKAHMRNGGGWRELE